MSQYHESRKPMRACALAMAAFTVLAVPDPNPYAATITIHPGTVIRDSLIGLGFNATNAQEYVDDVHLWNTVFGKRLKELCSHGLMRKSYNVEKFASAPDTYDWSEYDATSGALLTFLADIGTDAYLYNVYWGAKQSDWLGNGHSITDPDTMAVWAEVQADYLEHVFGTRDYTSAKYWCATNEMQTRTDWNWFGKWRDGEFYNLEYWRRHNQLVIDRLVARDLRDKVAILNTDQSGAKRFSDAVKQWIIPNMDAMTDIYGGHLYPKNEGADNWDGVEFYPYVLENLELMVGTVEPTGKKFLLGEFGGVGASSPGVKTALGVGSGSYGLMMGEWVVAALNAGVSGMCAWELHDQQGTAAHREWGAFKDHEGDYAVRPWYYSYGLCCRYIRKDSRSLMVESDNQLVHAAAVRHNQDGHYTVVLINRNEQATPIAVSLDGVAGQMKLRRFAFVAATPPSTVNGDLPTHTATFEHQNGGFSDVIPAHSMFVYTSELDETPPPAVSGLTPQSGSGPVDLHWDPVKAPDLSYYRIHRGPTADFTPSSANQIGSTIATSFSDTGAAPGTTAYYRVVAVDRYGNAHGFSSGGNTTPVTVADEYSVDAGTILSLSAPGILRNDYNIDGQAIQAVQLISPNGRIVHTVRVSGIGSGAVPEVTPCRALPSGLYLVQFQMRDGQTVMASIPVTVAW